MHLAVIAENPEEETGKGSILFGGVIGEDLPLLTYNTLVSVNIWQPQMISNEDESSKKEVETCLI